MPDYTDIFDDLEIFSDRRANNSARLVYVQMLTDADSSKLYKASYNKLARAMNMHRITAVKAVDRLIKLGYIAKITQTGDDGAHIDNIYVILK